MRGTFWYFQFHFSLEMAITALNDSFLAHMPFSESLSKSTYFLEG